MGKAGGGGLTLGSRLVLLLLLLQAVATVTLWTLNPTDPASQGIFATLLGVDLLAFAMVSFLYRKDKAGQDLHRRWLIVGCGAFVVLLLAVLVLA